MNYLQYYLRIIQKEPAKWDQLAQLIPLLRRAGRLDDAEQIMGDMEQRETPGRHYCLALIDYYKLDTESAMNHLVVAKRTRKWKHQSIALICSLCLGLDSDELNDDPEAIQLASQLICELPEEAVETKLLKNWLLLSKRHPDYVNVAIDAFQQLSAIRPEAALTGICAGFVQLKKPQAKNQLKRLSQSPWTSANFEHLERGYLILGMCLVVL